MLAIGCKADMTFKKDTHDLGPLGMRVHNQQWTRDVVATLYKQVFHLPLQASLAYGWIASSVGVVASIVRALLIDKVGPKPWYSTAFFIATVSLLALAWIGTASAVQVLIFATAAYAIRSVSADTTT